MNETKLKHYLPDLLTIVGIAGWSPPPAPSTLYLLLLQYLPQYPKHMVDSLLDWDLPEEEILFYSSLNLQFLAQ